MKILEYYYTIIKSLLLAIVDIFKIIYADIERLHLLHLKKPSTQEIYKINMVENEKITERLFQTAVSFYKYKK